MILVGDHKFIVVHLKLGRTPIAGIVASHVSEVGMYLTIKPHLSSMKIFKDSLQASMVLRTITLNLC